MRFAKRGPSRQHLVQIKRLQMHFYHCLNLRLLWTGRPILSLAFFMSHISWVLTSNNINNVPAPVRNRCQVFKIPDLLIQHLQCVARKTEKKLGLSEDAVEAVVIVMIKAAIVTQRRMSLRDVSQMLGRAEMLKGRPRLHWGDLVMAGTHRSGNLLMILDCRFFLKTQGHK